MRNFLPLFSILAIAITLLACSQDTTGEKELEISVDSIPEVIKSAIQTTYADAELLEAEQVTRSDGSIYYEVEIKHNGQEMELMYESDGSFLGIEEEGEDDEDDDGE